MALAFTENELRPEDTMVEHARLHAEDVTALLTKRATFVRVACPACLADDSRACFLAPGEADSLYRQCAACGSAYVSPRPGAALLAEYYRTAKNYDYWSRVVFPRSEAVRRERIIRPRVDRLLDICARQGAQLGTLMEVGAGFGTFVEELASRRVFQRVLAVEPTPALAAACRARGVETIEKTIEEVTGAPAPDVIVSFEVIEHLFDPNAFVAGCAALLPKGGLLIVTCPNVRGFEIEELGQLSPAIDIEHLNYFHPASLGRLLARHGFDVLETETPGQLDADIVRNRVLAGAHTLQSPFLRRVLVEEWDRLGAPFQRFLSESGLSSNMWLAARRRAP